MAECCAILLFSFEWLVIDRPTMCRAFHLWAVCVVAWVGASWAHAAESADGNVAGKIMPQMISQKVVALPAALTRAGITGTVDVAFTVDEKGRVVDPAITKTSDRRLNPYALKSLAEWKFVPGAKDGVIVPFRLKATIDFSKPNQSPSSPSAPGPSTDGAREKSG